MKNARSAIKPLLALLLIATCAHAHSATPVPAAGDKLPANEVAALSDDDIADAYVYLLGRLLVLRQQRQDFEQDGLAWNRLVHREPGAVAWANPNLDVAYSEAWVAVDERTCVEVDIPPMPGRYFTWHMLNGWGETVLNINERTYPRRSSGRYALCLQGAAVATPADALRIDLPGRTARVLARVELGSDAKEAVRLQRRITLSPLGQPKIDPLVQAPSFTFSKLPGAEAFDNASAILASEADINPGMATLQAHVRQAEALVRSGEQGRARVEQVIRERAVPGFGKMRASVGRIQDGWAQPVLGNYGSDYRTRTVANMAGIWANNGSEYVGYAARGLDGNAVYTQTFPRDALPRDQVRYFWSVTAVDSQRYLVIPNPLQRYQLNERSGLNYNADGSLTIVYAARKPAQPADANWLPTPEGGKFNLSFRLYGANEQAQEGKYFPPALVKLP